MPSIIAAEIGDERQALEYVGYALLIDLASVTGNASDGVRIVSAAGAWSALVSGFGGVRDFGGRLSFTRTCRVSGTSSRSRCGSVTGSSGCT